ncbi:unnamed protein product [Lepeophtheirus salmonis]|uniref:(salmon louse) hypothetical protein n=1 Tax=Lepeophtheirus salmonis TaxID=72036 RepID=A0A7R8D651_LEPSM|nr:unnamed protein product [Lepeophtheirus salmonis]CAF3040984.1 unnamed protein product [Lepeophtheirus salmonis]
MIISDVARASSSISTRNQNSACVPKNATNYQCLKDERTEEYTNIAMNTSEEVSGAILDIDKFSAEEQSLREDWNIYYEIDQIFGGKSVPIGNGMTGIHRH